MMKNLITTPVSKEKILELKKKFESISDSAGPLDSDTLSNIVTVAASNGTDIATFEDGVNDILQFYDGSNKRSLFLYGGYGDYQWDYGDGNITFAGFQKGALPGVGNDWAIFCVVAWD